MAGNSFGQFFKLTTFGESRSAAVGAVIDGCPAGLDLAREDIQKFLDRRRPKLKNEIVNSPNQSGQNFNGAEFSTQRNEPDQCEVLSGVFEGKTLGTPIAVLVRNAETSDKNYAELKNIYRPGHADYAYTAKYGIRDYRGGGRASGRETVGRVIGGSIAKKLLDAYAEKQGIKKIEAKIWAEEIAGITINENTAITTRLFEGEPFPEEILQKLKSIKEAGDSAGCILAAEILNVPEGLGSPVFDKLDAVLAQAIMSIGAVKGFQLGGGFNSAALLGSQNNADQSGGISGGISACGKTQRNAKPQDNGNKPQNNAFPSASTISFSLAVKPPPSIPAPQKARNSSGDIVEISIGGNHDICLFPRIVPVVEAMVYLTLADAVLANSISRI